MLRQALIESAHFVQASREICFDLKNYEYEGFTKSLLHLKF